MREQLLCVSPGFEKKPLSLFGMPSFLKPELNGPVLVRRHRLLPLNKAE